MTAFGDEQLSAFAHLLQGPAAFASNHTGSGAIPALREICDLRLLLAPEHGFWGKLAAGEEFSGSTDPVTGLEVLSLYSTASKRLSPGIFDRVETIVYDIQDVGCRYYTFISTLKYLAEDCAAHHRRLVVLDRPNPLGRRIEGNLPQPETLSFVGCHAIPVCYGLTCGEFARMLQSESLPELDLQVVPCTGWAGETFPQWGKPWIAPSPNIPRYDTAVIYPGTCLMEGTNCSEGRGTGDPFFMVGAPWVNAEELCREFLELELPGVDAVPVCFTPTASKYRGEPCQGIHMTLTDERTAVPTELGIRLLELLRRLYPEDFRILPAAAGDSMPFLSRLAGHRLYEQEQWDTEAMLRTARRDAREFAERVNRYCIYK